MTKRRIILVVVLLVILTSSALAQTEELPSREESKLIQVGGDPIIEDDLPLIDAKKLALILFWAVGVIGVEVFISRMRKKRKLEAPKE